ncbi:TPA: hypothetical protein ACYSBW_000050 [Klebsiella aerogenes]
MARNKEVELQRLVLLGALSTLDEAVRNEIFELKDQILKLVSNASEKEYALTALSLASIEKHIEIQE